MRRRKSDLDAAGAEVLFLAFSPLSELRRFQQAGVPGWTCLHDPERRVYAAYGLGRAQIARLFSPRVIAAYLRLLLQGRRPGRPCGDPRQLGGDFVVDAGGRLRLTYRSLDPADRPDPDQLVERLHRPA